MKIIRGCEYLLLCGDSRYWLDRIPVGSVNCCVTSPPYFGLRDYGDDRQIGLEGEVSKYVAELAGVFDKVWECLSEDGTLWLNLGDTWGSSSGGANTVSAKQKSNSGSVGRGVRKTIAHKQLLGIPWRVAFALQKRGWVLRQDIIWHKPSAMPESVRDRCTKAHEYVFLLTKNTDYYFDRIAIEEDAVTVPKNPGYRGGRPIESGPMSRGKVENNQWNPSDRILGNGKRNKRDVWSIVGATGTGGHYARMPEMLAELCISAGSSEYGRCEGCGIQYVRDGEGWRQMCDCTGQKVLPSIVLDPFAGSGTTLYVSRNQGRRSIGIELNEKYCSAIKERMK